MMRTSQVLSTSKADERILRTITDGQLDAILRASPFGLVPTGILDGVAIPAVGEPNHGRRSRPRWASSGGGHSEYPVRSGARHRGRPVRRASRSGTGLCGGSLVEGAPRLVLEYSTTSGCCRSVVWRSAGMSAVPAVHDCHSDV
jgi:hypothetical protein